MNCWRTKQLLAAYLDRELSPSEATLVEEHLGVCPECSELKERLDSVPPLDLPRLEPETEQQLWAQLDDALDEAWAAKEQGHRPAESIWNTVQGWIQARRLMVPVPVAAMYLLLIVGLTSWNLVTYWGGLDLWASLVEPATTEAEPATTVESPRVVHSAAAGMRSSIGSPFNLVPEPEEPQANDIPPLSSTIQVIDNTTGAVIYHTVDPGYPIGY